MCNTIDINVICNIILESQHLLRKSTDSIESIVSDICGLQYDPNPTIHLNQYMMLGYGVGEACPTCGGSDENFKNFLRRV